MVQAFNLSHVKEGKIENKRRLIHDTIIGIYMCWTYSWVFQGGIVLSCMMSSSSKESIEFKVNHFLMLLDSTFFICFLSTSIFFSVQNLSLIILFRIFIHNFVSHYLNKVSSYNGPQFYCVF